MSRTIIRVAAFSLALVASSLPAQGLTFGPELGVNRSTYGGADAVDATKKMGLLAGAAVKHQKEGKKMFVRSGVGFSQRGSKFSFAGTTGTIRFNYIEMPAMVGWSFPKANSRMTPHVAAGGALALKAGCTMETTSAGSTTSADCAYPKSMDIMVGGGAGVTVSSAMGNWTFDLLYLRGLSSVTDPPSGPVADTKNRGITFKAAYWIKKTM